MQVLNMYNVIFLEVMHNNHFVKNKLTIIAKNSTYVVLSFMLPVFTT